MRQMREGVEGVIQERHFGIGAVTLPAVCGLAYEHASGDRTVLPYNAVETNCAYESTVKRLYRKNNILPLFLSLGDALEPLLLTCFHAGESCAEVVANLRIVDPSRDCFKVGFFR